MTTRWSARASSRSSPTRPTCSSSPKRATAAMPPAVVERGGEDADQAALSPREIEVLTLVAQGLANKEVAARLGTARGTVKMHVQNILAKLNASDRTHAVTLGLQRGIIHL